MATGWDVASVEDAPLGSVVPPLPAADPWAVVKEEPIESAADRMKRHTATLAKAPSLAAAAKRTANLGLDIAGGLIGQVAGGVTGIGTDVAGLSDADSANLVHKAEGLTANQDPHSDVSALGHAIGKTAPVQAIGAGLHAADTGLRSVAGDEFANAAERVAGHVVNAAPVIGKLAGPAVEAAGRLAGRKPLKPLIPKDAPQVAIPAATAPDEVLRHAGYRVSPSTVANMTGAEGKPGVAARVGEATGGSIAGDNVAFNRSVSNGWGATDIGLPRTAILTDENIDKAIAPAAAGYERVKGALPDKAPVSDATRAALAAVGQDMAPGYELSPEVVRSNGIFSTDSFNAADLMKSIRAVKAHGNKNLLSDDPIKNDIGKAQIEQANALQAELDSRVATKVPALLGAYQAARRLFAKIYTIQDAREGYNIDPQALKRISYKNDGIDGGLRIVVDAATHAPEDVKLHIPPASGLGDVAAAAASLGSAGAAIGYGHPVTGGLLATGAIARPIIRSILRKTRGETSAANLDKLASPDSSLGNYFGRNDEGFAPQPQSLTLQPSPGPVIEPHQPSVLRSGESMPVRDTGGLPPPGGLAPPPGTAFEPHQPNLPFGESAANTRSMLANRLAGGLTLGPAAGRAVAAQGGPSLADLLSGDLSLEGGRAPPGLSLAPDRAPAPNGIPFKAPADFMSQGLEMAPEGRAAAPANNSDLAGVMSARVEKPGGMKVLPDVHISPFADRHIMPGSTVLLDGTPTAPRNYIALTPTEGGALRITSAYADPALSGTGRGQRNLVQAVQHAETAHVPLESDVTVTVAQLRAYEAAKAKGKLDFDYADPTAVAKALKSGNPLTVVSGKGSPVVTNIRTPDSLGAALGK